MSEKIKVLFISNTSKALTGFGKNQKNVLRLLSQDERFEVIEGANGVPFSSDLKTPWKSYGTYPVEGKVIQEIENDPHKKRLASYGNYTIDKIIEKERPDIIVGVEDIWAFNWVKKKWFDKINTVIWTTLDSLPILDQAEHLAPKVDKFLVWASFAEEAMKKKGYDVETLHGAVDYSSFYRLPDEKREELRKNHGLKDSFVTGFVFKNQLRKSVPNLLEGFRLFQNSRKKQNPTKLLLHTDWPKTDNSWDIEKYIKEKGLDRNDILATYICRSCRDYSILPYKGEEIKCNHCGHEKGFVTKSNLFGLTEEQLNEVYNIMDVYCHPFTSGGQELPIQEAKAAGLITLVTEYSCGTDSCYEDRGGLPLKWVEYREPMTDFIKASTLPSSICERLAEVDDMAASDKEILVKKGRACVEEHFSVEKTVSRLKEILLGLGKTDWDFNFEDVIPNYQYEPDLNEEIPDQEWLISLYKNIFNKNLKTIDVEIQDGCSLIKENGRKKVYEFLQKTALQKAQEIKNKERLLEDYFTSKNEKRIAVIMPESAGDVLMVNSLISNLKNKYEDYKIYFVTKTQFFPLINSHPDIENLIPYESGMDNLLIWEGQGSWEGYVDIAFLPFIGSQRHLNYMHNSLDK